ncbi:MAG: PqqD family protein [Candidatus Saganbacteria bacterium]|nr:PqqD family protein [Candidatus Saganbacteria bacterium]
MVKGEVLKKSSKIASREIEGEVILMPLYKSADDLSYIYTLNETAARFWELVDGKRSINEIKGILLEEFDVKEDKLDAQVKELLKDLKGIKAVG